MSRLSVSANTVQSTGSLEAENDDILSGLNDENAPCSPTDDYNIADADTLLAQMFPCELRYMDLSVLKLNCTLRVPWMVQIRDE